ncbi:hypothetical protein WMY93_033860 [Mugilogobius chulae]|uniref:Uncharacterized protein n=1 Tax=Mugilogobius chulae TaxID=88201 RepID=A0AAW0MSG7_9GOBI
MFRFGKAALNLTRQASRQEPPSAQPCGDTFLPRLASHGTCLLSVKFSPFPGNRPKKKSEAALFRLYRKCVP